VDRVQIIALVLAAGLFLAAVQLGAFGPSGSDAPVQSTEGRSTDDASNRRNTSDFATDAPASSEPLPPDPSSAAQNELSADRFDRVVTTLSNDDLRLQVSNAGGRVESAELARFASRVGQKDPVQLVTMEDRGLLVTSFGDAGVLETLGAQPFEVVAADARSLTQRLERGGVELVRRISIDPEGYGGELRLRVVNRGTQTIEPRFEVSLFGRERPTDALDHFQNAQLVVSVDGSLERVLLSGLEVGGMFSGPSRTRESFPFGVEWIGVESQYFLAAVTVDAPRSYEGVQESIGAQQGRAALQYPAEESSQGIPPGQQLEKVFRLYFGPKLESHALQVDPRLEPALRVGWAWVRPLVLLFAGALDWIYVNMVANYGVAIILLTILLRVATFPLTQRSMKSMKRLSTVAPQMREIQEKYREDSARMQEEMMSLYRRTGVNPFSAMAGGCLPMLLQMPFMVALYFALQGSIELRHAGFMLWIDDLSAPEHFVSIMGVPIRPLPLLMGASMVLQQWLTPSTGDEQQAQQRKMMMLMSGVFTVMFYQFPSGLVLYWLVSNLLGIGQQVVVNREPAK